MADFNNGLAVNGPLTISDEVTTSVHFGSVVKAIIDDCSRHTDSGAWRKQCSSKSWFTETLGGEVWIGQQASIDAAWSAANSLPGAVFQATATAGPLTSGKFYVATSSTTATEVFRGISRDYPDAVLWVAETGRVVGYDLTKPGCPMWMVFTPTSALANNAVRSIVCVNGVLWSATAANATSVNFVKDTTERYTNINYWLAVNNIANRSSPVFTQQITGTYLPNVSCNDVAITVLDTAPIDPATGLPVPTIAVATAGGVSVIKDDGTVVNSSTTSNFNTGVIWKGALFANSSGQTHYHASVASLAAGFAPTITWSWTASSPIAAGFGQFLMGAGGHLAAAGSFAPSMSLIKLSPSAVSKSLVANLTNAYNSGWQVGDSRLAALADTTAETITASGEMVTNGNPITSATGWGTTNSMGLAYSSGAITATNTTAVYGRVTSPTFSVVAGKTYSVKVSVAAGSQRGIGSVELWDGLTTVSSSSPAVAVGQTAIFNLTATATGTVSARSESASMVIGESVTISGISIKLADPDRSVKNTGLILNGTLTKTAVASGAGLVAYSGFSASNYLEQPYSANLDFGTGDFCVMGWVNPTSFAVWQTIVIRGGIDSYTSPFIKIELSNTGAVIAACQSSNVLPISSATITLNAWSFVSLIRISGILTLSINGVIAATQLNTVNLTNTAALLRLGRNLGDTQAAYGSNVALWRISATAPTVDQIAHIYRTELPLFQPNAQCTIAGTSTAVTALAYDDVADTLHVGTSWGRTSFKDLLRLDSEATSTGAITSLSANEGVVLTGGASSGKVYAPAMYLRDELRRKEIARKALGRVPAFFDYTATASQTAFVAPKGFTIKALYKNGTLMRETTTGVYWTRSNDGFQETATLSVGATVSDWISLMCVRG